MGSNLYFNIFKLDYCYGYNRTFLIMYHSDIEWMYAGQRLGFVGLGFTLDYEPEYPFLPDTVKQEMLRMTFALIKRWQKLEVRPVPDWLSMLPDKIREYI